MKTFLAIYLGSESARARWEALDDRVRSEREGAGMKAWQKWALDHAPSIVGQGGPLGRTKRIDAGGITDTRNAMAAYTVVQAESHEAAARLFLNHPHFMLFPGDSVELMESLPIPEMP
jgi:hypothetical protein